MLLLRISDFNKFEVWFWFRIRIIINSVGCCLKRALESACCNAWWVLCFVRMLFVWFFFIFIFILREIRKAFKFVVNVLRQLMMFIFFVFIIWLVFVSYSSEVELTHEDGSVFISDINLVPFFFFLVNTVLVEFIETEWNITWNVQITISVI